MTSTSLKALAEETLQACLAGRAPAALPAALLDDASGAALFGVLAEGLADRFEPALCDAYACLFSEVIARVEPQREAAALVERYQLLRQPRAACREPRRVFVLSRVTLGADVAVTSVLLAAALERFPEAEVFFVGPAKNFELFAAHPRLRHAPAEYRKGSAAERLAVREPLRLLLGQPDSLTLDPDSRLTQLGLLPVADVACCHLFESRGYGGDSEATLPELAAQWCAQTLGVEGARPFLALGKVEAAGHIAVSLGVGQNLNKCLPPPFEEDLLRLLASTGAPLVIDKGAGGEEAARVEAAARRAGVAARFWEGSFAGFARIISGARLYVGYDSAGQHVAAAAGVPLVTVFAGFPAARMFHRWRPSGERAITLRMDSPDAVGAIARLRSALSALAWPV